MDITEINERLAKAKEEVEFWEQAKRVFSDPRMIQIAFGKQSAIPAPFPMVGNPQQRPYGDLKKRVLLALPSWGGEAASTSKLVEVMESTGYTFASKTPAISVNEALVTLETEGLAFMVIKIGPTRYWTKSQPKLQEVAEATP